MVFGHKKPVMSSQLKAEADEVLKDIDSHIDEAKIGKKKYYLKRDNQFLYNRSGNFLFSSRAGAINSISANIAQYKMYTKLTNKHRNTWTAYSYFFEKVKERIRSEIKTGRIKVGIVND